MRYVSLEQGELRSNSFEKEEQVGSKGKQEQIPVVVTMVVQERIMVTKFRVVMAAREVG